MVSLDYWISFWGWFTKENPAVFNLVTPNLVGFRAESASCPSEAGLPAVQKINVTGSGADQGDYSFENRMSSWSQ